MVLWSDFLSRRKRKDEAMADDQAINTVDQVAIDPTTYAAVIGNPPAIEQPQDVPTITIAPVPEVAPPELVPTTGVVAPQGAAPVVETVVAPVVMLDIPTPVPTNTIIGGQMPTTEQHISAAFGDFQAAYQAVENELAEIHAKILAKLQERKVLLQVFHDALADANAVLNEFKTSKVGS